MKPVTKLWIGLGVLAAISPIGIFLPEYFQAGSAWGEWSSEEVRELVGRVPAGLERLGELWEAPMSGYGIGGMEGGPVRQAVAYILSAVVGIGLIALVLWPIGRYLTRKGE